MGRLQRGNQASPAVKHAHGPAVQLFCEVLDFCVLCPNEMKQSNMEKKKLTLTHCGLWVTVSLNE